MKRKSKTSAFARCLSQLKRQRQFASRRPGQRGSRFFVFVIFMSGLVIGGGTFSAYRFIFTAEAEDQTALATTDPEEERCKWKQDVAFFSALGSDDPLTLKDELVCEKKEVPPVVAITKSLSDIDLNQAIVELSAGYPLEAMAPAIARYDKEIAGLIVGIAKKESDWGKHVPLDTNGKDCFNYWGYKGAGSRGIAMGHGCFGSPEEAVETVGNRLVELVKLRQTSEPRNLTIWKCGSSCATHSQASVLKWVSDVDLYYQKIAKK